MMAESGKKGKKREKKPKKTKAELEEEARHADKEAERKKQKEYEREAEEKRKRHESELHLLEIRTTWRKEEVARLTQNFHETEPLVLKQKQMLELQLKKLEERKEWKDHINCNSQTLQGAKSATLLNEFLTETSDFGGSIGESLDLCNLMCDLATDLEMDATSDEHSITYLEFVPLLRSRVMGILDDATLKEVNNCYYNKGTNDQAYFNFGKRNKVQIYTWWSIRPNPVNKKIVFNDTTRFDFTDLKTNKCLAVRLSFLPFDTYVDHVGDLDSQNECISLGNSYNLDVFCMPSHQKPISDGVGIHQCISSLQRLTEPLPGSIEMTICLPGNILFTKNTFIALWDKENRRWIRSDDITLSINDNSVTVRSAVQCTFGFVQPREENLGYKSWSLSPILPRSLSFKNHPEEIRYSIQTENHRIDLDIQGSLCQLLSPNVQELEHVLGCWLPPKTLFRLLRQSGINLLPTADDCRKLAEKGNSNLKLDLVEKRAYEDCSWMASSGMICVRSSPLNAASAADESLACLEVLENKSLARGQANPEWKTAIVTIDSTSLSVVGSSMKSELLKLNIEDVKCGLVYDLEDYRRAFGSEGAYIPSTTSNLHIHQCLTPLLSSDVKESLTKCDDALLCSTIQEILLLTRPLSLST